MCIRDRYNAANPDAPMQYDMVAVKTNVPWFEIILYLSLIHILKKNTKPAPLLWRALTSIKAALSPLRMNLTPP